MARGQYTVTIRQLTKGYSQEAYDRYVAKEVKAMQRLRAKGHRDFGTWTDADMHDAATKLANYYNVGEVWQ